MAENTTIKFHPHKEYKYCADALLSVLSDHDGIFSVEIDGQAQRIRLSYDPARVSPDEIDNLTREISTRLESQLTRCGLLYGGANCDQCAQVLDARLATAGNDSGISVTSAPATFGIASTAVDVARDRVAQRTRELKPLSRQDKPASGHPGRSLAVPPAVLRTGLTGLAAVFLAGGWLAGQLSTPTHIKIALFVLAYLAGGYFGALEGLQALRERSLDVNLLMVVAALGAASIGEWLEGGLLLFLFSLSGTLEAYAMGRTENAIRSLMDLRPDQAAVLQDGREITVPVEALRVGDLVVVRPGERIPADGTVAEGESAVDQSPITGESMPVEKRRGAPVFAGTINGSGALTIRVTKLAEESTLSKIIELVAEAQSEQAPTQRFIDNFGDRYALAVIAGAILTATIPPLALGWSFDTAFYRAMTLLVVASPCALVISTPASILSAIANAARSGILFKGGAHLENAARFQVVAFDKTGTLTVGRPEVTDVIPLDGTAGNTVSSEELLALAASVEQWSEHPLAQAIVSAAEARDVTLERASDLQAVPGQGVQATLNGQVIRIGNRRLFEEDGLWSAEIARTAARLEAEGKTVMMIASLDRKPFKSDGSMLLRNGPAWTPLGLIAVSDAVRPDAREVIQTLRALGVRRIVMITGDNHRVAQAIGEHLRIDEVYAELLPEDKVTIVRRLKEQYGEIAVVGDGVNDAPALATASLGIAMGAAGTDVALETADVVLMADDLTKLPYAIALGRRARRVVKQNVAFSIAVIAVLIGATLIQGLPLPVGVVGHEGSTLVVVSNGLRLLGFRPSFR